MVGVKHKFIVKKSPIQGKGLFAIEDIAENEFICIMKGKKRSMANFERDFLDGNIRAGADPLQIGVDQYISLENPYNLINHSCDPNSAIVRVNELIAVKSIVKGEEISYDYSSVEWTPQEYPPYYGNHWPLKCNCGSASCRGMVGCFPYLPKELKAKYLARGIIQDHIIQKLSWPKIKQRCYVCEERLKLHKA